MDNRSLNDTKEGESAVTAGRVFHKGTVQRKKLSVKQYVERKKV